MWSVAIIAIHLTKFMHSRLGCGEEIRAPFGLAVRRGF
jgi:hypothetical protein